MRVCIVDSTYNSTERRFRGMAAKYLEWEIQRNGGELTLDPKAADVLAVTALTAGEGFRIGSTLKKLGIPPLRKDRIEQKWKGPAIVIGGQAAMAPAGIEKYGDVLCVGEGPKFLKTLITQGVEAVKELPNAWVPGDTHDVIPDQDFPWEAPPILANDGAVRIFASRSCKKKCLFCQIGWEKAYSENDNERLISQYDALRAAGYRVNIVTNDAPALSFFDEIGVLEHFSASYSQTKELIKTGLGPIVGKTRSIRFGVESPSSRLRRWIGKPIDTEDLFRLSVDLLNHGIGVRWFMIAGLPGERDEDYDELRDVVLRARHEIKKGMLQLSFTAFNPDPAAPLCLAPMDDDYWQRFDHFCKWFYGGGGFTKKIFIIKCGQPKRRLKFALGAMGADSEADLRRGWLDRPHPNWRVRYPLRHVLRHAYNVYAGKVGLPLSVRDGALDLEAAAYLADVNEQPEFANG